MDAVGVIVGGSWIFAAVLCAFLAIPLLLGKVGRNPLYGARLPQSFASDEAWFAINRFAAKRMLASAVPLAIVGVVALWMPLRSHPPLSLLMGFGPLILILAPAVSTWRFARRYASES